MHARLQNPSVWKKHLQAQLLSNSGAHPVGVQLGGHSKSRLRNRKYELAEGKTGGEDSTHPRGVQLWGDVGDQQRSERKLR